MNKKLIIGIIAAVVALALVVIGIISITDGLGSKEPTNNSSSNPPYATNPEDNVIEGEKTEISADKNDTETIITVPIKVSQNPGFCASQLYLTYDTDALVYVDYGKGDIFDEHTVEESKGGISCISYPSQFRDIDKTGTLITLSFKVNKNAKPGEYEIKIDKTKTKFGNMNEQLVKPTISTGKITVK